MNCLIDLLDDSLLIEWLDENVDVADCDWFLSLLNDRLMVFWFTDWLADWLIDWLIEWCDD